MKKPFSRSSLRALGVLALAFFLPVAPHAADHGDAPIASNNQSTDIADVFAFLDPTDNSRLILAMTQRGFIASGENANFLIIPLCSMYPKFLNLLKMGHENAS